MFSSSLLNTTAACSSPKVHYYHHLQEHHHLQESLFQYSSPVAETTVVQDAVTDHVPIGCRINPSFDKSKAMNMMLEAAEEAPKKKKKADNRSKIRTALGLRDRRVRMSIGIARKFFDLQDLLGFDKPSRTLEWLLTNSNRAILELSAVASASTTSSDQETKLIVQRPEEFGYKSCLSMHNINQAVQLSALKSTTKQKAALLVRESRNKARARARARTEAKLSTANLNHQKNRLLNNPEHMVSGDHQIYSGSNDHNFSSTMVMKSVVSESHKEEKRKLGDTQPQLQNYDESVIRSYQCSGLSPNLSLDHWGVCVYPQQGSSAAHQMDLSRDFNINGSSSSWDSINNNYRTL